MDFLQTGVTSHKDHGAAMQESFLQGQTFLPKLENRLAFTISVTPTISISIVVGLFNISNKLLVSLDIMSMRDHIRRGEPPGNCAEAVIDSILQRPHGLQLHSDKVRYLTEKLYDGYFAFEVLTDRDWNAGVCGVCGVCPMFESGDGNCKNCTPLTKDVVSMLKV